MKKERIDKLLADRGLADSRAKAHAMVMAGIVLVDDKRVNKPSETFAEDVAIRIKGESAESRYVGRGGLKLEAALDAFGIDPSGYVCLDVGSSTGGFTDCLLQRGAAKVVALDVGTNQLAWRIRSDPRVEVRENTNARSLRPDDFPERFDLIVMDVSFISVTKILPALPDLLLKAPGRIVVLIKPQFEVGKGEVGKGGIVRESEKHERVVEEVNAFSESVGLRVVGTIDSPITGAEGNREFLACYEGTSRSAGGSEPPKLVEGDDYYFEDGLMVLTERFLLRRGYCCENGCRHCPYGFTRT
jgi:23S rRNA (cytidine1920-2'-O)/16S rRNA (cytidine1409-2'-O)-methyltransferase